MTSSLPEGAWKTASFTLTGAAKSRGEACQDAAGSRTLGDGGFALAVADGAGSRPRSGDGAAAMVDALLNSFAAGEPPLPQRPEAGDDLQAIQGWVRHWEDAFAIAIDNARGVLTRWGDPLEEFATTLVGAVWSAPLLMLLAVGDGFACLGRRGPPPREASPAEQVHLVLPPKREGEDAGSGTHFVTSPGWRSHLESFVVIDPDISAVMLSTDGLEDVVIGYSAPALDGADGPLSVGALPQDVYLVADVFDIARSDGLAAVRPAMNTPRITQKKGDDIGVAFAVR